MSDVSKVGNKIVLEIEEDALIKALAEAILHHGNNEAGLRIIEGKVVSRHVKELLAHLPVTPVQIETEVKKVFGEEVKKWIETNSKFLQAKFDSLWNRPAYGRTFGEDLLEKLVSTHISNEMKKYTEGIRLSVETAFRNTMDRMGKK